MYSKKSSMRIYVDLLINITIMLTITACASDAVSETSTPTELPATETPTPISTDSPAPTQAPRPTETTTPTNTPEPTDTAQPTNTPGPTSETVDLANNAEEELNNGNTDLIEEQQNIEEALDSESEFVSSRAMIAQNLTEQGYVVALDNEDGFAKITVEKEDRNGNMQTYDFGELRENEDGETVFSIGEIRGVEKVFPINRVDIGEYTVERLTGDGGREEITKQKTRILTSDGRPYWQFMPDDPRLTNNKWGQVGEEFLKNYGGENVAAEYYDDQGRLRLKIGIGESFEGQINGLRWNDNIPDLEYEDPETGETRILDPADRYAEAYYTALWLNAAYNDHNDGITMEDIREGTIITLVGEDGELNSIDTGDTFNFMRVKRLTRIENTSRISLDLPGQLYYDYGDEFTLGWHYNYSGSPYVEEGELPVLLYNISLINLAVPRYYSGSPMSQTYTVYPRYHPEPAIIPEYMFKVSNLIFQLKDDAVFGDVNMIAKGGVENWLILEN